MSDRGMSKSSGYEFVICPRLSLESCCQYKYGVAAFNVCEEVQCYPTTAEM